MSRPPLQPPPQADLDTLADRGFVQIDQAKAHGALRWCSACYQFGVLYASHMPIPWGAYWADEGRPVHMAWTKHLGTAIAILANAKIVTEAVCKVLKDLEQECQGK